MTTQLPTTVNMIKIFKAFSPAAFARAARCTNAAAFVHKTLTKSVPESLGTRLSEIVHIRIFRCLNTKYAKHPDRSVRTNYSLLNTIQ